MASDTYGNDDQDQAEVFDEDNLDENSAGGAGPEFRTFEDLPDVLDLTARVGDARDIDALDEADFDPEAIDDEDLEEDDEDGAATLESDAYDETDDEDAEDADAADGVDRAPAQDVELVFLGDVQNRRGAQSSAAHFESRGELDADAVEDLGYADNKESNP